MVVTPAAIDKIRVLVAAYGNPEAGLRISLRTGGCSGTCYSFAIDTIHADDDLLAGDDVCIFLAPAAVSVVHGAKLEYGARRKPPRFRVLHPPNTLMTCPCGRSFGRPYPGKPTPFCQAYAPMPWDAQE